MWTKIQALALILLVSPAPIAPATGNRQPITGNWQLATGNRLPATGNRLPATDNRQLLSRFEFEQALMGTRFRIVLYAPDAEIARGAAQAAFARIAELEDAMSDYREESELMRLCRRAGGPPVRVPLEPEVYDTIFTEQEPDNLWPVHPDPRQHTRRTLYLVRKRNVRLPLLVAFDAPDLMSSCGARSVSVHALQALTLMNSDFMLQQSKTFAARLWREGNGQQRAMITRLYELALGRAPRVAEVQLTQQFLRSQTALLAERQARGETIARVPELPPTADAATVAAWVDLCLATLNLNEFLFLR